MSWKPSLPTKNSIASAYSRTTNETRAIDCFMRRAFANLYKKGPRARAPTLAGAKAGRGSLRPAATFTSRCRLTGRLDRIERDKAPRAILQVDERDRDLEMASRLTPRHRIETGHRRIRNRHRVLLAGELRGRENPHLGKIRRILQRIESAPGGG